MGGVSERAQSDTYLEFFQDTALHGCHAAGLLDLDRSLIDSLAITTKNQVNIVG